MSSKDKLIERFISQPKDFTFDEMKRMLSGFGFDLSNKGKTSGSRVRFQHTTQKVFIDVHKPHTSGEPIDKAALKDTLSILIDNDFIKI